MLQVKFLAQVLLLLPNKNFTVLNHGSTDTTFSLGSVQEPKCAVIKSTATLRDFSRSKGSKADSETEREMYYMLMKF